MQQRHRKYDLGSFLDFLDYLGFLIFFGFVVDMDLLTGSLDTFMVYNERKRVTSSAKRKRKPKDKSLHQACESHYSTADIIL